MQAYDRISNLNWRRWVLKAIEDKREDVGRATDAVISGEELILS